MAREHHCPNCGPQTCNASTSKIHTCGVCAAIWEEDLSVPVPVPAPPAAPGVPKPAPPAVASPKPAAAATPTPAPSPAPAAKPAAPSPPSAPTGVGATPTPAAPRPPPTPVSPSAATPPIPTSTPKPTSAATPAAAKTLADALQGAKVKRCPSCQSDGVAEPSDFQIVQGRLVLVDSQTYRAHRWYADTGELIPAAAPAPAQPAARASPAT